VENLADGLILAGTTDEAAGRTYIVTDGIRLTWREYLEKLTAALGVPGPRVCVHASAAYAAACVLESIYHLLGIRHRPPVTRYVVAHLSCNFHFSIDRARRELGYEPRIGIDQAIANTAEWYRRVVREE
jgi:nucleoside-diphosphate-sugar epimerase